MTSSTWTSPRSRCSTSPAGRPPARARCGCSVVEPYLWLRHVLRSLPTATTVEHFEALLPWNLNAEQLITA
ncbi:transposase domain-containing protein [Thauera sp.]|uniref:transposase domain-containing protein n=1 Tax=Thauera sp. TaxID=1905334 RepID=UPI00344C9978